MTPEEIKRFENQNSRDPVVKLKLLSLNKADKGKSRIEIRSSLFDVFEVHGDASSSAAGIELKIKGGEEVFSFEATALSELPERYDSVEIRTYRAENYMIKSYIDHAVCGGELNKIELIFLKK